MSGAQFDYTEGAIVELLEVFWDPALCYGIPNPLRADGGMPRGTNDPSHGGSWLAHVADMRTAWDEAPLTQLERIRIFMYYGLGWTEQEIADYHAAQQSSVHRTIKRGVQRLAVHLSGQELVA